MPNRVSTARICDGKLDSVAPSLAAESPPRLAFANGRLGWEERTAALILRPYWEVANESMPLGNHP